MEGGGGGRRGGGSSSSSNTSTCGGGGGGGIGRISSSMVMMNSNNNGRTRTGSMFSPQHQPNTNNYNNNPNQNTSNSQRVSVAFMPPPPPPPPHHLHQESSSAYYYNMEGNNNNNNNNTTNNNNNNQEDDCSIMRAKIMAHPHFPRLLASFANCQKVGAPPEVVARLEQVCVSDEVMGMGSRSGTINIGEDPSLDQFMEAYCEMLTKYEEELSKPFKEAMLFLSRIESQFKALTLPASHSVSGDLFVGRNGSSEEEIDVNYDKSIDPLAEDNELKGQLLRKYSGYLGSLKEEFLKKKKKGKLPKEARQQLLDWWSRHYKWPYPSESQKVALAESTGLDQKQINNWFINQRKRHWKPSDDMQFVVMDATHPHYYMDNGVMGNPYPMDYA